MTLFSLLKNYINDDKAVTLASIVRGPAALLGTKAVIPAEGEPVGSLLETTWADQILSEAQTLMKQGQSATHTYAADDETDITVFFDVHRPAPKLIIVGAVHIGIDLIHFAKPLGFKTYIVDPRTAFATPERFPHADHLIHQWPDEALPEIGLDLETCIVVVTHDPKLDDPALMIALPSSARYVGALGSPKTNAKRVERLLSEGLTQAHLDRLHAPIGLGIGGYTPAEIALSIVAEIVAVRNNSPLVNK